MTLIAVATYGNRAEFITDTLSYARSLQTLGQTSKHLTLPHLDAAVLTQGDALLGHHLNLRALRETDYATGFDELTATAPTWVRSTHETVAEVVAETAQLARSEEDLAEAFVILVGRSEARGEFVAYLLASETGYALQDITGRLWCHPMPWTAQPTELELGRVRGWMAGHSRLDEVLHSWRARPVALPPANRGAWVELACRVREQRALEPFAKVGVAGRVIHTRLRQGASETKVIHEFDDTGEEHQRMVAGTLHPLGQVGPCTCGSGRRYLDCCLAPFLDQPCYGCGSGKPLGHCCATEASSVLLASGPR